MLLKDLFNNANKIKVLEKKIKDKINSNVIDIDKVYKDNNNSKVLD